MRYEISIRGLLGETLLAAFPTMHAQRRRRDDAHRALALLK
jgi:hypothetical protein